MPRSSKNDQTYNDLLTRSPNGHDTVPEGRVYGQIVEVTVKDLPIKRTEGTWESLFVDLALRLEKTPAHKALAVPFESFAHVKRAVVALRKRFLDQYGKKSVIMNTQKEPPMLYVRRGEKWGTNS